MVTSLNAESGLVHAPFVQDPEDDIGGDEIQQASKLAGIEELAPKKFRGCRLEDHVLRRRTGHFPLRIPEITGGHYCLDHRVKVVHAIWLILIVTRGME